MDFEVPPTFSTTILGQPMQGAGLFTWDMSSDTLYADSALAELFGLGSEDTERGLPFQTYIARVHPEDAPLLARKISDAIIAEHPTE